MFVAGAEMGWRLFGGIAARNGRSPRRFHLCGEVEAQYSRILAAGIRASRGERIQLEIDSVGGDLSGARRIYDAMIDHDQDIDVDISGKAWSAAALIAMAGDRRRIAIGGTMMLHQPSYRSASGRRLARPNAVFGHSMILSTLMARKTGVDADVIGVLMEDETWLSASDAIRWGFCNNFYIPRGAER